MSNNNDFDDIDIDSWGKPPAGDAGDTSSEAGDAPAATGKARTKRNAGVVVKYAGDGSPVVIKTPSPRRESVVSRPIAPLPLQILTPLVLADRIKASQLGIAGELSCKNWLLHHSGGAKRSQESRDSIRTGELDYLIEIYRRLKNEGFE